METIAQINTKIVKDVLGNEKLKNFIFGSQIDFVFEYSGLTQDQIAGIQYTQSIRERMKQQFDLILKEVENKRTALQIVEKLLAKVCLLNPGKFLITVGGEEQEFITYLKNFKIPVVEKDERLDIPFLLHHGTEIALSGAMNVHEYKGKTSISVNHSQVGDGTSVDYLYLALHHRIKEKYVEPLYAQYLEKNSLATIADEASKELRLIEEYTYKLELKRARETLNALELLILKYKDFAFFFQEVSEKIAHRAEHIAGLEKISDPDMPIIERMYLCKNYHLNHFVVIPGEGKRFVAAVHGIHLWGEEMERIVKYLTEAGFGGSVILFAGVGIGPFERFLIKEKKLGAIIHNTGMHHESTLRELLEHSHTNGEDNDFCWSIPHNEDGAHGSEYNLTSKQFLERITNFL